MQNSKSIQTGYAYLIAPTNYTYAYAAATEESAYTQHCDMYDMDLADAMETYTLVTCTREEYLAHPVDGTYIDP